MKDKIKSLWDGTLDWTYRRLPPGTRIAAGLVLMVLGVFGFLPVIGFWMFPLGVAIALLDIKPVWRRIRSQKKT